jgi:acyl-CoA thioesterase-1
VSNIMNSKQHRFRSQRWQTIGVLVLAAFLAVVAIIALSQKAVRPMNPAVEVAHEKSLFAAQSEREQKAHAAEEEAAKVHLTWPHGRRLRVFFAGDSLASGYYSSVQEKAYRPLVVKYLEHFGSVEAIRATKRPAEKLFEIGNVEGIPDRDVDLAIIELGTNDAGRTGLTKFSKAYQGLIDNIRKGSPRTQIICVGVWGGEGARKGQYDNAIRNVCGANDSVYVDLTAKFTADSHGPAGTDTWAGPSDNFHPNDKGHRAIADLLIERISVKS